MFINEISLVTGSSGISHNGIFRGKDLGTISSLNEYIAFRSAHGIDDKSYKDLYLGDYFKIQDGTYNVEWMVAHFDYYYNKGNAAMVVSNGILLIPKGICGTTKMNNTSTTEGGYKATIANTTSCPAIATALGTVLGSYLLTINALMSNSVNTNIPSMAGGGMTGACAGWEWNQTKCILPNEVQIYGSTVLSSSHYDIGEANQKLALFNFINITQYGRVGIWLRNVVDNVHFGHPFGGGSAEASGAANPDGNRPLIYIG